MTPHASASALGCRFSGTSRKYRGPLLDRLDIHIDVPAKKFKELASDTPAESSAEIRERVVRVRRVQLERFSEERIFCNAQMSPRLIRAYCAIDSDSKGYWKTRSLGWGYRLEPTTAS
jgi:predicted ATPase with chaperone activity